MSTNIIICSVNVASDINEYVAIINTIMFVIFPIIVRLISEFFYSYFEFSLFFIFSAY